MNLTEEIKEEIKKDVLSNNAYRLLQTTQERFNNNELQRINDSKQHFETLGTIIYHKFKDRKERFVNLLCDKYCKRYNIDYKDKEKTDIIKKIIEENAKFAYPFYHFIKQNTVKKALQGKWTKPTKQK